MKKTESFANFLFRTYICEIDFRKCQINKINDDISVSEKFDMIKETYCIIINNAIRQCVTCLAS